MPLPSSGEIKLSQIRNEFSLGSGQIAMSQLRGKGNAPATGLVRIGGHFHGTSAVTYLVNSSIGSGTFTVKASPTATYRYGYSDGVINPSMGSMSNTSVSNSSVYVRQVTNMTGFQPFTTIRFSGNYTAWTNLIINGSTTLTRASATVHSGSSEFRWNRSQGAINNVKIT